MLPEVFAGELCRGTLAIASKWIARGIDLQEERFTERRGVGIGPKTGQMVDCIDPEESDIKRKWVGSSTQRGSLKGKQATAVFGAVS
jgi:hypothetical protein